MVKYRHKEKENTRTTKGRETAFRVYRIIVPILLAIYLALAVMMLVLGSPAYMISFIIILALFIMFVAILWMNRKDIRSKITLTKGKTLDKGEAYPVLYSSKEYFIKFWKWLMYEGSGILYVEKNKAIFIGRKRPQQQEIVLEFDLAGIKVNWIGRASFYINGAVPWLSIQTPWEEHYFTLEPGLFLFGSEPKTKALCQRLGEKSKQHEP